MNPRERINPCPLAVGFHCWEDQSTPMLDFTCFYSVPWNRPPIPNSKLWSDDFVTSILFAGTKTGTIVAYKILSNNGEIIDAFPICFLFGHKSPITCITRCSPFIYTDCVASLSKDGTLSIISVEDLTIVVNRPSLFSENSNYLANHEYKQEIMIASQIYGTIEIANVIDGSIIMTISGFQSIISSITHHGSMHAISTYDGTVDVLSISENDAGFNFSTHYESESSFITQSPSPDLTFLLTLTDNFWEIIESGRQPFRSPPPQKGDSYSQCGWISTTKFFIRSFTGKVQIFEIFPSKETSYVFDCLQCRKEYLFIKHSNQTTRIEPFVIKSSVNSEKLPKIEPKLILDLSFSLKHYSEPISASCEGFVIYSPGKSIIQIYSNTNSFICDLSNYFSGRYRARCGIMRPISHEARIDSDGNVFLDNFDTPIGIHKGSFLLYSPPLPTQTFLSFSNDGSICIWGKTPQKVNGMTEAVKKVNYVVERRWIICIATFSFIVIDCFDWFSVCLCDGHESPIVDVTFVDGVFHARTESSDLYVWSCDSELIGKDRVLLGHETSRTYLPNSVSLSKSISSQIMALESAHSFSDVVSINMPNCQTFVVVLNISDFVTAFEKFDNLDVLNDPTFLPLKLLWTKHVEEDLFGKIPILGGFGFCQGGDNNTVTLPISFSSHKRTKIQAEKTKTNSSSTIQNPKLQRIQTLRNMSAIKNSSDKFELHKSINFNTSSLLSAIHCVAASATAQCFVSSKQGELSLLSAKCQIKTAMTIKESVPPMMDALATWLLSPSPDLRFIIYNVLLDYFATFSMEEVIETVDYIMKKFPNWNIRMPFIFVMCKYIKEIPQKVIKEAAENIFPIVTKRVDYLKNLANCFNHFISYLKLEDFFKTLISNLGDSTEIISFALNSPLEFINAVKQKNSEHLVEMFLERWLKPDPKIILQLVTRFSSGETNNCHQKLFERLSFIVPFVGICKDYSVIGDNNGFVTAVERGSGNVLFSEQIFQNDSVKFVSASSNGVRFVSIANNPPTIAWFINNKNKSQNHICLQKTEDIPGNVSQSVASCVWNGDTKVVFFAADGSKLYEAKAPNLSFFQRIF